MEQVRLALDGLASALARADVNAVMAAESPLAEATAALVSATSAVRRESALDEHDVTRRIAAVRLLLERCRMLGAAPARLTGAMFATTSTYGPAGAVTAHARAASFTSRC